MFRLKKPQVVQDVARNCDPVFTPRVSRVNLTRRRVVRVPVFLILKVAVTFAVAAYLVGGYAFAPGITIGLFAAGQTSDEERRALEAELQALEQQIDEYEAQVVSYQKRGRTLKDEVARLNGKIAQLNLKVKAATLRLRDLDGMITETASRISIAEDSIRTNKQAMATLIRDIQRKEQVNLMTVLLEKPTISDFFGDLNNIALLQSNLHAAVQKIRVLHEQLTEHKTQLSLVRADAETVKQYQDAERREAEQAKSQKNQLLTVTKGEESRYQNLLKETKEKAAQIRSRIFQLLGGGELTFEQAYQYAKLAGDSTGIRPALILAVLDRESALGQNVGRCKYNEVSSRSGKTVMHPTRDTPIFLEITSKLGINPESVTVSCPNADGTYGGAMGPAQFIPSTWRLYEAEIARVTGRQTPSPWNNADAFVATALYLKDAGAARDERIAAAKYYCGGSWRRYVCTNIYGRKVVERAQQFEQDIVTITS